MWAAGDEVQRAPGRRPGLCGRGARAVAAATGDRQGWRGRSGADGAGGGVEQQREAVRGGDDRDGRSRSSGGARRARTDVA